MGKNETIRQLADSNAELTKKLERAKKRLDGARKRIKDLAAQRNGNFSFDDFFTVAFEEIYSLLLNAVKIENLPFVKHTFVKKALFERGQVGYLRSGDVWTYVTGNGINGYSFPPSGVFASATGEVTRGEISYEPNGERYLILANELAYPLVSAIAAVCDTIATLDVGIRQNAKAVRIPRVVVVDDSIADDVEAVKLSLEYANDQIEDGVPVIKVNSTLGKALTDVRLDVELIADRLLLVKQEIRNEFLTRLGILTANTNKRERVQVGEVNARVGECVDSIYTIIDCFNAQMTSYALPFKMTLNGVLEAYFAPEDDEEESDET